MGVKLQDLVIREPIDFSKLAGKIIAVDAPNIIMSLFNFARKNPDGSQARLILDRTQRPISHLYGLLYRTNFFYSKKIFPIFCFDGLDSDLKKLKTKDRLNDFLFTEKLYRSLIRSGYRENAKQIALSKEYMWPNIVKESKQLLGALGVPYLNAPASAESQCAQLVKDKIAHYSNSQDFDSLLFSCPKTMQNLSKSPRRKVQGRWTYQKITPVQIDLKETLKSLKIDRFQLVDMAILIGNDYFQGIKNIGPKHAHKFLLKHKRVEKVIHEEKNTYDFSTLTPNIISKVRKIYLLPEVVNHYQDFRWDYPNEQKTLFLLCEEHHLNKERVKTNYDKFSNNYEKCKTYFERHKNNHKMVQNTLDQVIS
jgi:flap endonuclease-1